MVETTQQTHAAAPRSDKSARTVLLVDDDPDFVLQQKTQLESAGFRVVTAESAAEAEEVLQSVAADLAVIDLMMENTDSGFSLSFHMKKQRPAMPVILVSSVNSETRLGFDTASAAQRSWIKADAFLSKPIRFEQLQKEIERLLK